VTTALERARAAAAAFDHEVTLELAGQIVRPALSAEPVPPGSAGSKALAVVRSDAEIYAHSGGQPLADFRPADHT
jgi:hypothetical protein